MDAAPNLSLFSSPQFPFPFDISSSVVVSHIALSMIEQELLDKSPIFLPQF